MAGLRSFAGHWWFRELVRLRGGYAGKEGSDGLGTRRHFFFGFMLPMSDSIGVLGSLDAESDFWAWLCWMASRTFATGGFEVVVDASGVECG